VGCHSGCQGRYEDGIANEATFFALLFYLRAYTQPSRGLGGYGYVELMPGLENNKWRYVEVLGRYFDRDKFEGFKARFYKLQGWDPQSGYLTRDKWKSLGLDYVANELDKNGKLGKAQISNAETGDPIRRIGA
jgi:hypothetical protein